MKVCELMQNLGEAKANAVVVVNLWGTLNADVDSTDNNGREFIISGGDAELLDEEGNEMGLLSSIARNR